MTDATSILDDDTQPGDALSEYQLNDRLRMAKLIVILDRVDAELRGMPVAKRFFGHEEDPVNMQFSKFVRAALAMQYKDFTLAQKRELDWLFYERLPETVRALKTMKRHEYDMFAAPAVENLVTHLDTLLNGDTVARVSQSQGVPKPTAPRTKGGTKAQLTAVSLLPGTRFPLYNTDNQTIAAALRALGETWQTANASELATEDRYTVNAIVDTYLPEAWGMFQKLVGHPKQAQQQAAAMFIQQVQLMQQQVDEIVERSTQSALSNIQAYTLFLQGKVPQPGKALKL